MKGNGKEIMIRMAKRLFSCERRRLRKKTEEAQNRGGVSASLFLEGEMNALSDADCFFFYGTRLRPKGLLTVFFPDEEHAEITVAEFVPGRGGLSELYRCALTECKRVGAERIHTVRNPVHGFRMEGIAGVRFSYEWSEYMLCTKMSSLATSGTAKETGGLYDGAEVIKDEAPEGDGTFRYRLFWDGQETAECRILPAEAGRQCYLFGLETRKEFRRRGMATVLLREIAKEYASLDGAVLRLQVSSQNEPAEHLYRKLGFVTEEEREYYRTEVC